MVCDFHDNSSFWWHHCIVNFINHFLFIEVMVLAIWKFEKVFRWNNASFIAAQYSILILKISDRLDWTNNEKRWWEAVSIGREYDMALICPGRFLSLKLSPYLTSIVDMIGFIKRVDVHVSHISKKIFEVIDTQLELGRYFQRQRTVVWNKQE